MRALISVVLMLVAGSAVAAPPPTPVRKPIVAVVEIQDLARTGQAATLQTMMESAIATTGKFRLMERTRMGVLTAEQGRAKAGLVTTNTPGKIGGFEGADFLVYGAITTASSQRNQNMGATVMGGLANSFLGGRGNTSPGFSTKCANSSATLGIDVKITDASTGEIKYATRINESQRAAVDCNGQGEVDSALLLRSAADRVASGLVTTIYPIQIAAVQSDGGVILNYGEGAITPGAVMAVYSKGQAIIDPATGAVLGNDETRLGLIRINEVTPRMSKASLATAFAAPPPIGSIVRPALPSDIDQMNKAAHRR